MPFIAVTERAFTTLVNENYAVLRRSIAAQERLQRIVLSERGLDAIAAALATQIGGALLVFDGRGQPLAQRRFRRELPADAVAAISASSPPRGPPARPPFAPDYGDAGRLGPRTAGRRVRAPRRAPRGAAGLARRDQGWGRPR